MKRIIPILLIGVILSGCGSASLSDTLRFSAKGRALDAKITATENRAEVIGGEVAAQVFAGVGQPDGPDSVKVAKVCYLFQLLAEDIAAGKTTPTLNVKTIVDAQGFDPSIGEAVLTALHAALEVDPLLQSSVGNRAGDLAYAFFLEGFIKSTELCRGEIPAEKE